MGVASISHFFLQTVWAQVWPDRSKLLETLTLFLIFYLETKVPIRLPVRRLVWTFVVRMYQRRISRDKVHTISKNSKLNVKVYTRYTPGVFVFPFVRSSFLMFIILLINCSLSLSLSLSLLADADPELLSLSLCPSLSVSLSHSLSRSPSICGVVIADQGSRARYWAFKSFVRILISPVPFEPLIAGRSPLSKIMHHFSVATTPPMGKIRANVQLIFQCLVICSTSSQVDILVSDDSPALSPTMFNMILLG